MDLFLFFLFEKRVNGSITQQTPCIYRGNLFLDFNLKAFLAFCFLRSNCLEMEKNKKKDLLLLVALLNLYYILYIYIVRHGTSKPMWTLNPSFTVWPMVLTPLSEDGLRAC